MAAPKRDGVQDALASLVDQFSDPLAFFRELIQNSLDAGSPAVEIRFNYTDGGVMIIEVDDFGEGMDREIIDKRLTRLFSSAKDGDFTKIGRFGIGFVSVFALAPDAVCLDTSRGGESWRVLFKKDRSFVRIARDEPIDGTRIQLIKAVDRATFDDLRGRARETVRYWCKHVQAEILFDDEPLNEPFDLALACKVRHEEPGTTVVVGYALDEPEMVGFYNKGLTLLEGATAPFEGVSFKVSSRYLEHTLTRDNVLRDDNFHKAMKIVGRLIEQELPRRLFELLEQGAEPRQELLGVARRHIVAQGRRLGAEVKKRKLFETLAGAPVTLGRCCDLKARGLLFHDWQATRVTAAIERQTDGLVLAVAEHDSALLATIAALPGKPLRRAGDAFCCPRPADADERQQPLLRAAAELLDDLGVKLGGVALAHFDDPGASVAGRVAVSQVAPGDLTPLGEATTLVRSLFSKARTLVINADHPTVEQLIPMAHAEPEVAAYLLVKLFHLGGELTTALDTRLASFAFERRRRRAELA